MRAVTWLHFWTVRVPVIMAIAWVLGQLLDVPWSWTGCVITVALSFAFNAWLRARVDAQRSSATRAPVELVPGQVHVAVMVCPPPRWYRREPVPTVLAEVTVLAPGDLRMGFDEGRLLVLNDAVPVLEVANWQERIVPGGALGLVVRQR